MIRAYFKALFLAAVICFAFEGCKTETKDNTNHEVELLSNEDWWGGAVLDGRNSPLNQKDFDYDQLADCKGNQSAPLFLSDQGRVIWSDKPLHMKISGGKIDVTAHDGELTISSGGKTLKEAFLYASRNYFPPSGKIPEPLLFTSPQYNTWIELKYDQNEKDILEYAENIVKNDFPVGVIMIDDNWQDRYGTWEFDCEKFSDPRGMIDRLHKLGFKVMLWVVPYISPDSPVYRELEGKKVLVFENPEKTKPAMIHWWNGVSAVVDLSNPEGEKWFKAQLAGLAEKYNVDGFKLDAGDPEAYTGTYSFGDYSPNDHCESYARIGLSFPLNELRACWKMGGQPLVQRLRDKSHTWDDVRVLIPDMIALGLIGHQFGCPDMIGGGEWTSFLDNSVMDEELVVRACQVSALMPMMQFSVAPWRILSPENLDICRKMAGLHFTMGNEILAIAKECAVSGEPMVRNLEYEYPGKGYEAIKDQFFLGSSIMVAPVVNKGQYERDIVFPEGKWKGDDGNVVEGPATVKVSVPLDRLPWYRKVN